MDIKKRVVTYLKKKYRPEPYRTNRQEGDLTIDTARKRIGTKSRKKRVADQIKKATNG